MVAKERGDNSVGTSYVEAIQRFGCGMKILKNAYNLPELLGSALNIF
jgi:hypothetical protein